MEKKALLALSAPARAGTKPQEGRVNCCHHTCEDVVTEFQIFCLVQHFLVDIASILSRNRALFSQQSQLTCPEVQTLLGAKLSGWWERMATSPSGCCIVNSCCHLSLGSALLGTNFCQCQQHCLGSLKKKGHRIQVDV